MTCLSTSALFFDDAMVCNAPACFSGLTKNRQIEVPTNFGRTVSPAITCLQPLGGIVGWYEPSKVAARLCLAGLLLVVFLGMGSGFCAILNLRGKALKYIPPLYNQARPFLGKIDLLIVSIDYLYPDHVPRVSHRPTLRMV